ncbi:MAG: hypothetical protein WEA10_09565 [Actinomycetota bacterium]
MSATRGTPSASERLDWLTGVLWPASSGARTTFERPRGEEVSESYLVIPGRSRARFLVPAAPRPAAAASVRAYNRLRSPRTRLLRSVLGIGLDVGLAQPMLRDRLSVVSEGEDPTLLEHLRLTAFDDRPIVAGIGIGSPGPFRKPVLQVFSREGRPLGFVKVGWNEVTRALVRTEADLLARCGTQAHPTFATPRLLHTGRWRDLELSVASPLPLGVDRWRPWRRPPPLASIRDVAALADGGVASLPLARSPYWRRVGGRLEVINGGDTELLDAVRTRAEAIEAANGDTQVAFGAWHGDWSPWNFARSGGELVVWDWEHGDLAVPFGFDIVHFFFQLAFIADGRPLGEALDAARASAAPMLRELDVERPGLVATLHTLEVALRYAGASSVGAGVNPRFASAAPAILRRAVFE